MINLAKIIQWGNWCTKNRIPFVPKVLKLIAFVCYSSSVDCHMRLGKGSFFNHSGFGVLINPSVVIGSNCKIGNNVSIVGQGPYKHAPQIGNKVYIGPGAVIQGPVIIEDDVIIAPNAVVTRSIPEGAIVAGVPAKIIGWKKDLNYDIFADENWDESIKPYMNRDNE